MDASSQIINVTPIKSDPVSDAILVHNLMVSFVQKQLKQDTDFGVIPGTNNKPVLFKPGAEKLCRLFKLRPHYDVVAMINDYEKNIFHYHYRCSLYRNDEMVGQGDGIASSKEKKYQRKDALCPHCKQSGTVFQDNKTLTYYCWVKKGGCGAKGIKETEIKFEESFDYTLINTICKMAQKRAFVAVVLNVTGGSEFFTQDLEEIAI